MQAIRQATAAGGQTRFPVDFTPGLETLLPYTQEARDVAKLLALDAWVSAHEGKGSQALEDVRGIFALSEAMRGEPTQISQFVRIAVHGMGCDTAARLMPYCSWSDAELQSLQAAIQTARFKEEMARALCGERAIGLSALDEMPLGPLRRSNAGEVLRFFESVIEDDWDSWPEILRRQRERSSGMKSAAGMRFNHFGMVFVQLIAPAIEQGAVAGARAEATQTCTTAAIAVERFRLQHGRWPESLGEIEGLIPKATTGEAVRRSL